MKKFLVALYLVVFSIFVYAADPLPSWNDGEAKQGIIDYIKLINTPGDNYIPASERIATFDHDGTLASEQPVIQLLFISQIAREKAGKDPALLNDPMYKAIADNDWDKAFANPRKLLETMSGITDGMTVPEYKAFAVFFVRSQKYPKPDMPLHMVVYQPQLELLKYLRDNDFKIYICSGGEVDFMRAFSMKFYKIPKENVIGSVYEYNYDVDNNTLTIASKLAINNDTIQKTKSIEAIIGRPPVFASGNVRSGGDIYMLRYSQSSKYPSFQFIINHDDDKREFMYSEKDNISLNWAKKYHWHVVSMKNDWKTIYP